MGSYGPCNEQKSNLTMQIALFKRPDKRKHMHHAFYLPPSAWGDICLLQGQEARHLIQALRLQVGDNVMLFDGEGKEALCRITHMNKREASLCVEEVTVHERPCSLPIMALAWSKATRRGFFMEKAVELGVHEVWLWQGEHSQGRVPDDVKEHWHGQCVAALKQSRNPWLPQIRIFKGKGANSSLEELLQESAAVTHRFLPWEQSGDLPILSPDMLGQKGTSLYVIGPEGGFSAKEVKAMQGADFQTVSLGDRVLRCETAALLCLGLHYVHAELRRKSA